MVVLEVVNPPCRAWAGQWRAHAEAVVSKVLVACGSLVIVIVLRMPVKIYWGSLVL